MTKRKISGRLFLAGLVSFMILGFFLGQFLERPVEYRQVVSVEVALDSKFVSTEEERGVSHRDVIASYADSVSALAVALNHHLGAGGFSREVSASQGLANLVRLVGEPSGEELSQTGVDDAVELLAARYQFEPILILSTKIEKEELETAVPGWQLGLLGSIGAGLSFSMFVVLAQAVRTVVKENF